MPSPGTDKPEPAARTARSLPQIDRLEGVGATSGLRAAAALHSACVQYQIDTYA
jgi:hypothetical protein